MSSDSSVAMRQEFEVAGSDTRFAFGKNWHRFLQHLDDERIAEAEKSLCTMLAISTLVGKSFLDIGSGSGLFSLAAMRLGADKVHSFDYDAQSVACTQELKRRYFADVPNWTIQQGSVLDSAYLSSLGQFDVVYSWGVLHHTGNMWQALSNVAPLARPGGKLFIAIYNDQDMFSRAWAAIKLRYNRGRAWRFVIIPVFGSYFALRGFVKDTLILHKNPMTRYRAVKQSRGMAYLTDLLDWLGGYPFEVAKPEAIFEFFKERGFQLLNLKTAGIGHGNNEFVFLKCAE